MKNESFEQDLTVLVPLDDGLVEVLAVKPVLFWPALVVSPELGGRVHWQQHE